MTAFNVGDRVRVTLNCIAEGCVGTIEKTIHGINSSLRTNDFVYVKLDTLPVYHYDRNPVRLSTNSVELVKSPSVVVVDDMDDKPRIGMFFDNTYAKDTFALFDTVCLNEVTIVFGYTKEDCLEKFSNMVSNGDYDENEYSYLLFDGVVYEFEPKFKMVIV